MVDWHKKHFEHLNTASRAFEQFNRFEKLYAGSIAQITKDLQVQQDLINNAIGPFSQSYVDMMAYRQPEIDRIRHLHSSTSAFETISQANSRLATLFKEQNSLSKQVKEAFSINQHWLAEIQSIKGLNSIEEASRIALSFHCDGIAHAALLAQERLINSHWSVLGRSVFHKTGELTGVLESFNVLTGSYNSLIHSFGEDKSNFVDFPPFVSGLPPVEILTCSDLIDTISREDPEERVENTDALENEIRDDIESSLDELLVHVNPEIKKLWLGAKSALSSTNPDKKRHVVVSLREMLTHVLHGIAPDSEVKKWTSDPSYFHDERPTREARLLFVCRDINSGPFKEFVNKDVESHIKFIRLFQRGTHELNIDFTEQQLRTLFIRSEALARFLLITWKSTI